MKELGIFIGLIVISTKIIDYFTPKLMRWITKKFTEFEQKLIDKSSKFIIKIINYIFPKKTVSNNNYYEVDTEVMKRREKLFVSLHTELKTKSPTILNKYTKKELLTDYETYFYNILLELENELDIRIQAQINLRTIINKESLQTYANELFRNIDFGIFTKDCKKILLLIEIDDKTHQQKRRIERDKKVKEICSKAEIKLIKFYSNYPNEKQYVKNRIKQELNKIGKIKEKDSPSL